jgi:hypothetical protein
LQGQDQERRRQLQPGKKPFQLCGPLRPGSRHDCLLDEQQLRKRHARRTRVGDGGMVSQHGHWKRKTPRKIPMRPRWPRKGQSLEVPRNETSRKGMQNMWPGGPALFLSVASLYYYCIYVSWHTGPRWPCVALLIATFLHVIHLTEAGEIRQHCNPKRQRGHSLGAWGYMLQDPARPFSFSSPVVWPPPLQWSGPA